MYILYLLAVFLLLGVDGKQSTVENKTKNDVLHFQAMFKNQEDISMISTNFGFNPKQIRELEYALNAVVGKFFGPQQSKLSLRTTGDPNTGIANTLRIIGQGISNKVQKLSEKFGLSRSTKSDDLKKLQPTDSNLKATLYYYLLNAPLKITPIWQEFQNQIEKKIKKKSYIKMGYKSPKIELQMNYGSSIGQLKIAAIISTVSKYSSHFSNCLDDKQTNVFNIKKAFGSLMNFSPERTAQIVSIRLDQPIPKSPENNEDKYTYVHAVICQALVGKSISKYRFCLEEIKHIEKCVRKKLNDTSHVKEEEKISEDFLRTIKSLDDSCKNTDKRSNVLLGCKIKTRITKSNMFPHIVEFFMGDLEKSPKLRQMATEIGSMITKNHVGSEAINEIITLIEIYKNAMNKRAKLMRYARNDVRQRSIFSRISDVLSKYKEHIYNVTKQTVKHVHSVMSKVEKVIVDSASTLVGEDISINTNTMRSWSGYMNSVLVQWSNNQSEFQSISNKNLKNNLEISEKQPKPLRGFIKVSNEVGFIKSPHDKPLNKLIISMKRLGKTAPPRRTTALVSLANTFLLATMFYECISLLAGAIYRDDSSSVLPNDSLESEDTERWQTSSARDRRSSPPIDYEDYAIQGDTHETEPFPLGNEWSLTTSTTENPRYEKTEENFENIDDNSIKESDEMTVGTTNSEDEEIPESKESLFDVEIIHQIPSVEEQSLN